MNENNYIKNNDGPRLFVEPRSKSNSAHGPKFKFTINVSKCSSGHIVSVTRIEPHRTKVKVVHGKKRDEEAIEAAIRDLKEKLSRGNV